MKELIDSSKLDNWIKFSKNVLFIGKHGVGKTSAVIDAFNRANLKWLYFSASTCDPFIDFVGVPRVVEENGKSVLKLIRQEYLEDDSIEAIFIDEYNRAPKKMKNAVMELVQFKSINGRKYPNLKVVWAAINPEDDLDTYDVEPLDPAQKDRFHIWLDVEYRPCPFYLENKYGENVANNALDWWNKLSDEMKQCVSPRRLCYALDYWLDNGDIREILPSESNVGRLIELLNAKPIELQLKDLFEKDSYTAMSWINVENNFYQAYEYIKASQDYVDYFIPLISNERLCSIMDDEVIFNHLMLNFSKYEKYRKVCLSILKIDKNSPKSAKIKSAYIDNKYFDPDINDIVFSGINRNAKFYTNNSSKPLKNNLISIENDYVLNNLNQSQRDKIWAKLLTNVPDNISSDLAVDFLKIIEAVTFQKKATIQPWQKYNYFVEVINTLTKSLVSSGKTYDEISSYMPNTMLSLQFHKDDECYLHPRNV